MNHIFFALSGLAFMTILIPHIGHAADEQKARAYLAQRADAWIHKNNSLHVGDCMSCHTTLPLMLTTAVRGTGDAQWVRTRVEVRSLIEGRLKTWNDPVAPTRPWYGGIHAKGSRDTESVLNAVSLITADLASPTHTLTDTARSAIHVMIGQQNTDGGWTALDYGLEPWESSRAHFWTSAMAGIALGQAAHADAPLAMTAEFKNSVSLTRQMLSATLSQMSAAMEENKHLNGHDTLMALWANQRLGGILVSTQKDAFREAVFALQNLDGGFALDHLMGPHAVKAPGPDHQANPRNGRSDAYATGLAVYVLRLSGTPLADPRLQRGAQWLVTQQGPQGAWPADPLGSQNPFNQNIVRDAGVGYALLALDQMGMLQPLVNLPLPVTCPIGQAPAAGPHL